MPVQFRLPIDSLLSAAGVPLAGGGIYFYTSGTSTPLNTYSDSALAVPNTNPVRLDAEGRHSAIYLAASDYKVILKNASGVQIGATMDPVSGSDSSLSIIYTPPFTGSSARTVQAKLAESSSAKDFGAVGDGVTNDATALNAWLVYVASVGGNHTLTPGTYLCNSQVTLTPTGLFNVHITAYGAEIKTSGAISGFKVSSSATPHVCVVEGLKINHRGNTTATYGMEMVAAAHCTFLQCVVEVHGVQASYRAFIARNSDPTDSNTGTFWAKFINCTVRKRSGADVGDIPAGVCLRGAANATIVQGCSLSLGTTGDGILIEPESAQTYVSNGVLLIGNHVEGALNGVRCTNNAGGVLPTGLKVFGSRIETCTSFFKADGATVESVEPPQLSGNYCAADVTNYINNTTATTINNLDAVNSGSVGTRARRLVNAEGTFYRATQIAYPTAQWDFANVGQKLLFTLNSALDLGWITYVASGIMQLAGNAADTVRWCFIQVNGISGTLTRANNLRGSATFSAATTVAVTFATAESDATYFVQLTAQADPVGRLWVSAKGTGGFTINNSSSTSIAVNWFLVR